MTYSSDFFVTHYCLSLGLTAVTSVSLGIFILFNNSRSTVNRLFAIFMVLITLWSSMQMLIGTWHDPSAWLLIARIEHYGHVFIPTVFLHFVHAIIGLRQPKRLWLSYAISLAFFSIVHTHLLIDHFDYSQRAKFALDAGPGYALYMAWFAGTVIEAMIKLRNAIAPAHVRPKDQLRLKYVFWATLIGYAGGLPNFLYVFDIDAYPLNPFSTYFVPLYPIIIAYAIVKHQALDISVVIRKSLVYSVLVAIITAIYFSFVLMAEKVLQGVMGYRSLVGSLVSGFIIAFGFNPLKDFVQRSVDRVFFRGSQTMLEVENQRLRQEVARSEKLKSVATLAAGMAHEIKNPLTSIKTFAEYLPQRYDNPTFREKFARIVGQEVEKINSLVLDLLEFAKPSPPKKERIRLSHLINETIELLHARFLERQVEVNITYGPQDEVLVDPAQMKQVFLNVLLNSVEAMKQSGRITISTMARNGDVSVLISDNGMGIPQGDLVRVFDPFYTTKPDGTGLGLSVVHSIIREHGGHIALESELDRGTTVRLNLPLNGGGNGKGPHLNRR